MTSYLLKILAVLLVSNFVIFLYYFIANGHTVNATGYSGYAAIIILIYGLYKGGIYLLSKTPEKVVLKISHLFLFFILHLFILCCFFFSASNLPLGDGVILFFKIVYFSVFPIVSIVSAFSLGYTLTQKLPKMTNQSPIFQFLLSLGFGFTLFVTTLVIFALLGLYNIVVVGILCALFLGFGYTGALFLYQKISQIQFEFDNRSTSPGGFYLFSSELLFYFLTLLIATNLISVVRPVPIGWDDLGVYMNYPHLMAQAESLLSLGSMYSWQVFTGLGFMAGVPTQAFFFNSIGGMLSFLVIFLVFKDFFRGYKKTFLNIPLLITTTFAAMPMIVFQLAKDMKLDPGLLFISTIALYIAYIIIPHIKKEKPTSNGTLLYIAVIGILVGFAFTIKFTTLLLVSGLIGLIAYRFLSISGLIGYILLYVAIFTQLGLWSYLNVSYDTSNTVLVTQVSFTSFILGVLCIGFGVYRHKLISLINLLVCFGVFILGVTISMSPWIAKNVSDSHPRISIGAILSGKSDNFVPDFSLVRTAEEIKTIGVSGSKVISASGTTANEDFGRYFGYEKGINNYIKLPVNLTMQKNQGGEFTDITFIFLALIPIIFLFLPFRRKEFLLGFSGVVLLGLLLQFFPPLNALMTLGLGAITLPLGYIFILLFFLVWLVFAKILDSKKDLMKLFIYNLVFTLFYTFLWTISAYGIVWYGIVMYIGFFLMIAISLYYVSSYEETDTPKKLQIRFLGSAVVFFIFFFYFIMSAFPNAVNNIKGSSYATYKNGQITTYESVFDYQTGYLEAIYALNIDGEKQDTFLADVLVGERVKKLIATLENKNILYIVNVLKQIRNDPQVQDPLLQNDAYASIKNIYNTIVEPKPEYKNTQNIYRIGTFLKYYISENNSRVYNDSLLFSFYDYMLEDSAQETIKNIKTLGMQYILVDLNAATIDKDVRRNLTKRYESLLKNFVADDISLVSTDSICLRLALAEYVKSEKTDADMKNYMELAGVNYESYTDDGKVVYRTEKLGKCYDKISNILNTDVDLASAGYEFLSPIKAYLLSEPGQEIMKDQQKLVRFFSQYVPSGRFALFQIQ